MTTGVGPELSLCLSLHLSWAEGLGICSYVLLSERIQCALPVVALALGASAAPSHL